MAGQLALQPRARVRPISLDGADRQPQVFRNLRAGHPGKESKDHYLGRARIDGLESGQCRLEREQIFDRDRAGRPGLQQIVQGDGLHPAAALHALLLPAVIDQETAHRLRPKRQAVRFPLPLVATLLLKP